MKQLIVILKRSLHTISTIVAMLVLTIYLITHFNLSGYLAKNILTGDLAEYLDTEVSLGSAEVDIFNQIILENLLVKDQQSDTLLYARRAMVSFDFLPLLQKELQIHTVQLIDFDIRLSKHDSILGTNFQFIIDRFVPKGNRKNMLDDIAVNSVILRSGNLSYNDYTKPYRQKYIDKNHLQLSNISANLKFISSKKDGLYAHLKRLSFAEKSDLYISRAASVIQIDAKGKRVDINDIKILCRQRISDYHHADINLSGFASIEEQKLNGDIVSLNIDIPEMLSLSSSLHVNDILALDERTTFNLDIPKLNITSQGMTFIAENYAKQYTKKANIYINNVYDINIQAKAEGSMNDFKYESVIESFGDMSSDINADGHYTKEQPLNCNLTASIKNLPIDKHKYEYVYVQGNIDKNRFDGTINIEDPACEIEGEGEYYYRNNKKAIAKASIKHIEPYLLSLTTWKNAKDVCFSGNIMAKVNFGNNKYPEGGLLTDSLTIRRDSLSLFVPNIDIKGIISEENYLASINSDIINAQFEVGTDFKRIQTGFNESKVLSEIFKLPLSITKNGIANLQMDSDRNIVSSEIILPEILYDGATIEVFLTSKQETDSLKHELKIDYKKNNNHLSSTLYATSVFKPLFIDIQPCKVVFNNDLIDCEGATLKKIEDNIYDLERFILKHKEQSVNANGKIATDGSSDLTIHIENLDIDTLCSFLKPTYLKFGGNGTGDILYTSDSIRNIKTKDLLIKDFSYLGGLLGNTRLDASYDIDKKRVELSADVLSEEDSLTNISGYIQIAKKDSLDLMVKGNRFNIEFLKHWVGSYIEELQGNITGDVHLYGLARELKLVGRPYVDASFTNHLSGSRFYLKDYVTLTKEPNSEDGYILFDRAKISDKYNHEAYATATILHKYLRKYNYDVRVDMPNDQNGFLLFDKPTHYNNELYWGQLFTSGSVMLRGGDGRHRIEISCKTEGKSQFNLSPGEENYSDNGYNFLTFRDKIEFEKAEQKDYFDTEYIFQEEDNNKTYIEFDIQAEATENCQMYVQMDPLAEDRLICRGTGNISLHYDPRHDINIGGEYKITSGNYLVTMRGDLINKEFKIQNGSRVIFPGNFSNAELDINAVYSIPSVNLRDLDDSFATMTSINRTTLPVDCKLAISGQLNAPQIAFDLEVKNTSDDVQALVHNLIGTQEMLNREVFYLLLFSKFYTPEYATTTQNNTGSELTSFTSASLTSQLNNLLGHMSDYFTLGTNFRSDKGDFSDMEMDFSLSTRLFSDRLILNGNLGYRDPANRVGINNGNNNSFIGDFDVEYLINRSGSLRAKAYSHYNERDYSINNALTTQGIGFVVRRDYKSFKELLFWNKKSEKK